MSRRLAALLVCMPVLAACSTIVFENGSQPMPETPPLRQGHHIGGGFERVQFSGPKDLQQLCGGHDWHSIRIEQSFVDGVFSKLIPYGIYAPRSTYTLCQGPAVSRPGDAPGAVSVGSSPALSR